MKLSQCIIAMAAVLVSALAAGPSFAAPSQQASPFGTDVRDQVGVNIHFTDAKPGEMEMLSDAGFGLIRMDFSWSWIEKTPGVYDFSAFDTLASQCAKHHIRPLFILDYANPLYDNNLAPHTDTGRAAFVRWVQASVNHFHGKHIIWEMWNEPNGGFWKPHADVGDYTKLALAVGKAFRETAPHETYIGPATAGIDWSFLESCFQAGLLDYWSGVSVHPYRGSVPDTAAPEYQKLAALIAKYAPPGKAIPILSGEWGYSVATLKAPAGMSKEDAQANYFDREILTNLASHVPVSIWYDWHNDGPNPDDNESNFGLVRNAYHAGRDPVYDPKPSYVAAKTLLHLLGDYHFEDAVSQPDKPDSHILAFTHKRDHRYAAWTGADSPQPATIPLAPGSYTILDSDGTSPRVVTVDKNGLALTLTNSVQYIVTGAKFRMGK